MTAPFPFQAAITFLSWNWLYGPRQGQQKYPLSWWVRRIAQPAKGPEQRVLIFRLLHHSDVIIALCKDKPLTQKRKLFQKLQWACTLSPLREGRGQKKGGGGRKGTNPPFFIPSQVLDLLPGNFLSLENKDPNRPPNTEPGTQGLALGESELLIFVQQKEQYQRGWDFS